MIMKVHVFMIQRRSYRSRKNEHDLMNDLSLSDFLPRDNFKTQAKHWSRKEQSLVRL